METKDKQNLIVYVGRRSWMLSSSAQGLDARDKGKFTAEANHFIWKKKNLTGIWRNCYDLSWLCSKPDDKCKTLSAALHSVALPLSNIGTTQLELQPGQKGLMGGAAKPLPSQSGCKKQKDRQGGMKQKPEFYLLSMLWHSSSQKGPKRGGSGLPDTLPLPLCGLSHCSM